MLNFFKRKKDAESTEDEQGGLFSSLKKGLSRTRESLVGGLSSLIGGGRKLDADTIEEIETLLLMADLGIEATQHIIDGLSVRLKQQKLDDGESLYDALSEEMYKVLEPIITPFEIPADHQGPFVILMVGINGAGKTTTIAKLTQRFLDEGRSVMLAAGDTFRAAAVEQLQTWGERHDVPVIAQQKGADSASVIFDALQSAKSRNIDILIADTAGRLHTQSNLMEELKKIRRVMGKLDESAPHEVMLVIDAGTGQNAINQVQQFHEAVNVSGITLTKLDGTAKGGIIFALAQRMNIPIRFIGIGEKATDLRPFDAVDFISALLDHDEAT